MTQKIGSVPQWYLGADCLATDSVLYPRSITGWDGDDVTAADVGDVLYAVLMNKDKNKMELLELDASDLATYDTTGLAILKRGLPFFVDGSATDLVEVAANKLNWAVGDILLVGSHPPVLFRLAMKFANGGEFDADYDFTGQVTFDSAKYPKIDDADISPVDDEDFATKKYVDDVASGAGVNYNRLVVEGVAGEDIVAGEVVYFDGTDKEWKLADASVAGTSEDIVLGIAQGVGSDGVLITGGVLLQGLDSHQTALTIGDLMYLSDTAGAIANTAGTVQVELGYAYSATQIVFSPRFKGYISKTQKDALAGTSGTPSSTNKFVTDDDTTGTGDVMRESTVAAMVYNYFGDASDGDVTIAADTNLTRDMYYNDLTIADTKTLNTRGFRVYVKGTLNCVGTGKIANNGGAGGDGSAGSALAGGGAGAAGVASHASTATLPRGTSGVPGGARITGYNSSGNVGADGTAVTQVINGQTTCAAGGNGGDSNTTTNTAAGGASGAGTKSVRTYHSYFDTIDIYDVDSATGAPLVLKIGPAGGGGSSGASGGGANGGGGGGSGASGGFVWIAAYNIDVANIEAKGGNGGNGGACSVSGGCGGGGAGGNGGVICYIYHTKTTVNTDVTGGTGGAIGTGSHQVGATPGGDGQVGLVYSILVN